MCTRAARAAFLIVAAGLSLPRTALAQARIDEDKMVLRAAFGHGVSGSQSIPDGAHAWTVALDRHIRSDWWFRGQVQHIGAMDLSPRALSPTNAAQVSLSSVAVAAYRLIGTPGVPRAYVGGGFGAYRYRLNPDSFGSAWGPGAFILAGVQVPDIVHSLGAYVEGSIAYVQGPQKGQLYELSLGFAVISVGARFSF